MVALNNKKKSKICLKDKVKDFEDEHKKEIEEANKRFEKDIEIMTPHDEDDVVVKESLGEEEDELDDEDKLLTFGQKIHMAQKPMKKIFWINSYCNCFDRSCHCPNFSSIIILDFFY